MIENLSYDLTFHCKKKMKWKFHWHSLLPISGLDWFQLALFPTSRYNNCKLHIFSMITLIIIVQIHDIPKGKSSACLEPRPVLNLGLHKPKGWSTFSCSFWGIQSLDATVRYCLYQHHIFQILTDFFFNKDSIPHVNLCDKLSTAVFFLYFIVFFRFTFFKEKKRRKKNYSSIK